MWQAWFHQKKQAAGQTFENGGNVFAALIILLTMNDSINGRNFLKQAGMSGVGLSMAGYFNPLAKASESPARKIGANDKITAAVIGTNGRGLVHIDCLTTRRTNRSGRHCIREPSKSSSKSAAWGIADLLTISRLCFMSRITPTDLV
jgi:hypothetical protein